MIYVGLDVSSKSFVVHAINERKKVLYKGEVSPTRAGLKMLNELLGKETKVFVFEAGNQLKWIAQTLKKMSGVRVHVVHPNEVKWIVKSNGKTDKVDAKKLAELARADMLPRPVHIVEGKVRELREFLSAREQLQSKRVAMINAIHGLAKQEGHRLPTSFFKGEGWQSKLEETKFSATLKQIIRSFMSSIEALLESEKEITERVKAIKDERVDLLETIPAIGTISSRVLLSALDKAERFNDKKAVANYGALTPTIYQSGGVTQLGHINRDGRHEVRKMLLQCAHTITRMKSLGAKPLKEFFERIARKRGKKVAIVALARKLLTIAYGVLKTGKVYDPVKLAPYAA